MLSRHARHDPRSRGLDGGAVRTPPTTCRPNSFRQRPSCSRWSPTHPRSCRKIVSTRCLGAAGRAALHLPVEGGWGLWAIVATCASAAQVLQSRSRVGQLLSAPLTAILLGLALAAAGLIPLSCQTYDQISSSLLPLAAALYLLESDLTELTATARETLVAFLFATFGTIVGTLVAWALVGSLLGPEGWKVAAALAASYVGGSVNFAATSTALGAPSGSILAAAMSADMLAMAGYLALIGWWPVSGDASAPNVRERDWASEGPTSEGLGLSLAAATLACALGSGVAAALGVPDFSLGLIAIVASMIASLGPVIQRPDVSSSAPQGALFRGAEALGGALMSFFFVTIGAAAGSFRAVLGTGWLLVFITIQLSVHLGITMGLGRLLRLPTQALLTASNAAVGGPGTAAAMATTRGWTSLVRPALIIGAFGYSIGTTIGVSLGQFVRPL